MKNLKNILILILVITFISCNKSNDNNAQNNSSNNSGANMNTRENILFKKIKDRTKRDLKKIGIKSMLLSKNGKWWSSNGEFIKFKNDGKADVYRYYNHMGYFYWKVENGKLYIKPNNIINRLRRDVNKFYKIKIEATTPTNYSNVNEVKKYYKYSLLLKSQDENVSVYIDFAFSS